MRYCIFSLTAAYGIPHLEDCVSKCQQDLCVKIYVRKHCMFEDTTFGSNCLILVVLLSSFGYVVEFVGGMATEMFG